MFHRFIPVSANMAAVLCPLSYEVSALVRQPWLY